MATSLHSEEPLFDDGMTLKEARDLLRTLVDEGYPCPCCTQYAKVYRRKVNASMSLWLIALYRSGGVTKFVHGSSLQREHNIAGRDYPHMAHWGLIEEEKALREDGGRSGWWRLTNAGEEWARNRSSVPKYARVYDGRLLQLLGEPVRITDALGTKFYYRELMES